MKVEKKIPDFDLNKIKNFEFDRKRSQKSLRRGNKSTQRSLKSLKLDPIKDMIMLNCNMAGRFNKEYQKAVQLSRFQKSKKRFQLALEKREQNKNPEMKETKVEKYDRLIKTREQEQKVTLKIIDLFLGQGIKSSWIIFMEAVSSFKLLKVHLRHEKKRRFHLRLLAGRAVRIAVFFSRIRPKELFYERNQNEEDIKNLKLKIEEKNENPKAQEYNSLSTMNNRKSFLE